MASTTEGKALSKTKPKKARAYTKINMLNSDCWHTIFSWHDMTLEYKEELRYLCRTFRDSIKRPRPNFYYIELKHGAGMVECEGPTLIKDNTHYGPYPSFGFPIRGARGTLREAVELAASAPVVISEIRILESDKIYGEIGVGNYHSRDWWKMDWAMTFNYHPGLKKLKFVGAGIGKTKVMALFVTTGLDVTIEHMTILPPKDLMNWGWHPIDSIYYEVCPSCVSAVGYGTMTANFCEILGGANSQRGMETTLCGAYRLGMPGPLRKPPELILNNCHIHHCPNDGVFASSSGCTISISDCEINNNYGDGVHQMEDSRIDIYGSLTNIHHNSGYGLNANLTDHDYPNEVEVYNGIRVHLQMMPVQQNNGTDIHSNLHHWMEENADVSGEVCLGCFFYADKRKSCGCGQRPAIHDFYDFGWEDEHESGWNENSLQEAYESRFVENDEKYLAKNWFEKQHKYTYRESRGLDEDGIFYPFDTW